MLGGEKTDAAVTTLDQVPAQVTRTTKVIGRQPRQVSLGQFMLLQEQNRGAQLAQLLDVASTHRSRPREKDDRTVDAPLVHRLQELLDRVVLQRGLDQQRIPLVAEHVSEPRHEEVGHRVGKEARRRSSVAGTIE